MKKLFIIFCLVLTLFLTSCSKKAEVIFDSMGGSTVPTITNKNEFDVSKLPTPTKEGYTFEGWFLENSYQTPIIGNVPKELQFTLYAKWKVNAYTITINENGGNDVNDITANFGEALTAPVLTRSDYDFDGWDKTFPTTMPSENMVITAKWKLKTYTITINENGGEEVNDIIGTQGTVVTAPVLTRVGFTFDGWDKPFPSTITNEDIVLTAKWIRNSYTIDFVSYGEISVTSIKALYEDVITAPVKPIRNGYEFVGWYEDEAFKIPFTFNKMPGRNFTLYAKWEGKPATMNFDSLGGNVVQPITLPVGSPITKPIAKKTGYSFVNWYLDSSCTQLFEVWTMPVGGVKLYAKWNANSYTITFNTMGGSQVTSLTALFDSDITAPNNPTKSAFVFEGWYTDSECKLAFEFNTMPTDTTLYAKWVDANLTKQISYVKKQKDGTKIEVEGIVFAETKGEYQGFYILDGTGFIFVLGNQNEVQIGDKVNLKGYYNNSGIINGVNGLTVLSKNCPLTLVPKTIETIYGLSEEHVGEYYETTGVIVNEEGRFYLVASSGTRLLLDHRFTSDLDEDIVGSKVKAKLVLTKYDDIWAVGLIDFVEETVNNADKTIQVKTYLTDNYLKVIQHPGSCSLPKSDLYNWSTISYQAIGDNAHLYDAVNHVFLDVLTSTKIKFSITINIDGYEISFEYEVVVNPTKIISISDFIKLVENTPSTTQGTVITESGVTIIYDSSASIFINADKYYLETGDQVIITSRKSLYANKYYIDDNDIIDLEIINREVAINNPPSTIDDLSELLVNDPLIYGRYVKIKGYLKPTNDYEYCLDVKGKLLSIEAVNQNAYMELVDYNNLEVEIHGYISEEIPGQFHLLYLGHRNEINIPEYTDQELVNALQNIFNNQYGVGGFNSLDTFVLPSQLPMYSAQISWQMTPESRPYFNEETQKFNIVQNDVTINIDITIVKNAALATLRYSVTLHPLDTLNASEFNELGFYEEVFIQGLITYRHPDYLYLLVDNQLIFVNMGEVDAYRGDYVIIHGIKKQGLYSNEVEIYPDYNSDYPELVAIMSRGNEVTTPMETTSIPKILSEDYEVMSTKTRYVQISGYLELIYTDFDLTYGNQTIKVRTIDEYTFHELQGHRNKFINIRGYLKSYEGKWYLVHTGVEGEVSYPYVTDLDKYNLIVANYASAYNLKEFDKTCNLNFGKMKNIFGATISIVPQGTNANLINVETGTVQSVTKPTVVEILMNIKVGSVNANSYFSITIVPNLSNVPQLKTIAEFKQTTGGTYIIQGTVVGVINQYYNNYALIKDANDLIYMNIDNADKAISYSDIGKLIEVTGELTNYRGRYEIAGGNEYKLGSTTAVSKTYENVSLAQLTSLDNRNDINYGKTISVKGQLVKYDYESFYLTDGNNRINVIGDYSSIYQISRYEGFKVELKAFFFGYLGSDNDYSIIFDRTNLTENITLLEYTDEEIVNLISEDILNNHDNREYKPFDEVELKTYHHLYDVTFDYQFINGAEYVDYDSPYFRFRLNDSDQIIKIDCTITYQSYTKTITLLFKLKGYLISNLEDLFKASENTKAIYLHALVVYSEDAYRYFMIDDNIYYLDGYFDGFIEAGTEVILSGKKTNINGFIDYTYDIEFIYISNNNNIVIEPVSTTLNTMYTNDYSSNYIYPRYLRLYGKLKLNQELNLLYLESDGKKVYIRTTVLDNDYMGSRTKGKMSYYDIEPYFDELVYIDVFFPNLYIFKDYYLVDFRGYDYEIKLPEYTPEEDIDLSIDKFLLYYSSLSFISGERLDLPYQNQVHHTSFRYSVTNAEDQKYLSFSYSMPLIVDSPKQVSVDVLVTHETEISQTITINVTINPRPITSIREVVWGRVNERYIVEGVVQLTRPGSWILLKDETDSIYIKTDKIVAVGDKIKVLGTRSTFETKYFVPVLHGVDDIVIVSQDTVVPPTPKAMTFKDILSLDYLDIDIYNQYITLSGFVLSTGNIDYPCYELISDDYGVNYKIEMVGPNYKAFNDMMKAYVGKNITIKGYLLGFEYIYSPCDWYILFDGLISSN